MGLIADSLAGLRFDPAAWLGRDDQDDVPNSSSGIRVDSRSAMSLTTFWRCVDLISHAVSMSPRRVIVRTGGTSFPEYQLPQWLIQPDPRDPNMMPSDYFLAVTASMLVDGNFFTAILPNVLDPQILIPKPAKLMVVRPGPFYDEYDVQGRIVATWGPDQMLHGWWMRMPGEMRGISPLENFRRSLGGSIAADEFAGRYFGQGAALSFGVEVPGALSPTQADEMRMALERRHMGVARSHAVGILTRGAKFVTSLQPTPEQSQMLLTRKFGVEDTARIFGVPPALAGSQEPGAASYASVVALKQQFRDDAVLKFTEKLEAMHGRLLSVPEGINDPNATVALQFDLDWIGRADMLTRYQAHAVSISGGFRTPNAVRHDEGEPAMEGGDQLYMLQQMVPITELGMTKATEPLDKQTPSKAESAATAADAQAPVRSELFEYLETRASQPQTPTSITFERGAISLENPTTINIPERSVEVRVEPAPVSPTPVEIHNEIAVAPTPVNVMVEIPAPHAVTKTIVREGGLITKIREEPTDGE